MIRLRLAAGLLLGLLGVAAAVQDTPLPLASTDRILILAPHPDDETLGCGGVIQQAVALHIPVKLVFLTYGDFNKWSFTLYRHSPVFRPKTMRAMGEVRRQEALDAARVLDLPADALIFLGYPDYETLTLWDQTWDAAPAYESRNTRVTSVPYATAFRPGAPYKGDAVLQDLDSILKDFRPTKIFFPHPMDRNVDHRALALFLRVALWDTRSDFNPALYPYLVHFPGWPAAAPEPMSWTAYPLEESQVALKAAALAKHRTQNTYSHRFLTSFVRRDERFATDAFKDQDRSTALDTWTVTRAGDSLIVTGRLARRHPLATHGTIAIFGYRRDTPFAKMPKLYAPFNIPRHQRDFTAHFALATLQNPEKILVGCEVPRPRKPFPWTTWKILE